MQSAKSFKIAVLGAESTGKSQLCHDLILAQVPTTCVWNKEFLREFCEINQRTPYQHEQPDIFAEQIRREIAAQNVLGASQVLCDSTPLQTALYSQLLFDDDSLLLAGLKHQQTYQLNFVCQPDFPWTADAIEHMRDGPQQQQAFNHLLTKTLIDAGIPLIKISGRATQRVEQALAAILKASR